MCPSAQTDARGALSMVAVPETWLQHGWTTAGATSGPRECGVCSGVPSSLESSMPESDCAPLLAADTDDNVLDALVEVMRQEALFKTAALQDAIFNSTSFSSIATDANGVIQIFNVGA